MKIDFLNKGREALSTGEWEKARDWLQKAIKEEECAEAYEELAWACWWLNDTPAVFEYRSRAYHTFLENDDKIGAARCACWICLDYIDFKGEFAIASGWFKRAENLLEGVPNSWELAFIKILKARFTFEIEKNSDQAFKYIEESLKISKSLGNVDGEMLAEALKGSILVLEGKITEGMPLLDEATLLALTSEQGDIKITTITCCYLIDACDRIRDYERATQWCNNVKEICKRWRYKAMFASCRVKYASVLMWKGNWKEAEEELASASTELAEYRPLQVTACTVRLADLRRRQGRWDEAEMLFNKVDAHPLKQLYLAYFYFDKEEYEHALNMGERFLRQIPVNEKAARTAGVELLLRIYLKQDKPEQAQNLLEELKEITKAINTPPLKAALLSAKGRLKFHSDDYELAKQNLEDAADLYDKLKTPFEAARTRMTLAKVLIKLNQNASAEKELNLAMTAFKELEAKKDFEKAKFQLKHLYKNTAGEADKNKYDFTGRELEVLGLIASGKNNEEIAGQLFLSVRTVEKHITNIYSKMGISGKSARAFAASYAIRNNLIFT